MSDPYADCGPDCKRRDVICGDPDGREHDDCPEGGVDFFQEFDRYCDRNNIPMDKSGEAFAAFLREYAELPDVVGHRIA